MSEEHMLGATDGAGASALAKSARLREQRRRQIEGQSGPTRVWRALVGPTAQEKRPIVDEPEGMFAGSGLPVLRSLRIRGYPLYYPRRLAKHLRREGPISLERALDLQAELAHRLRPAAGG